MDREALRREALADPDDTAVTGTVPPAPAAAPPASPVVDEDESMRDKVRRKLREYGIGRHDALRGRSARYDRYAAVRAEADADARKRRRNKRTVFWPTFLVAALALGLLVWLWYATFGHRDWALWFFPSPETVGNLAPTAAADSTLRVVICTIIMVVALVWAMRSRYPFLLAWGFAIAVLLFSYGLLPVLAVWAGWKNVLGWHYQPLLFALAAWIVVRTAYKIAARDRDAYVAGEKRKGLMGTFVLGLILAIIVVTWPVQAEAVAPSGGPVLNQPPVTRIDPQKLCGNNNSKSCANILIGFVNNERGLLNSLQAICGLNDANLNDSNVGKVPAKIKGEMEKQQELCGSPSNRSGLEQAHRDNVNTVCSLLTSLGQTDECNALRKQEPSK